MLNSYGKSYRLRNEIDGALDFFDRSLIVDEAHLASVLKCYAPMEYNLIPELNEDFEQFKQRTYSDWR